ncbi:TPA: LysM peptidoglycan-binding domain-containing protein [Legionella pneumophila]|nr:LysM peptidoglycan-binding domain-containing protein [Legionella pneumophila]
MNCNLLIIKKFLFCILIFIGIPNSAISSTAPDVWDVLRSEFTLSHEVTRPEVQEQIRWLISHPSYINKVSRQSEPYIYHVLGEIKKRKLPGELALLPMIESAYDPFAYSGAGAAGIWQLMPRTGSDLGLKQDWWFDGRRSIGPSTDAALNYLVYLNKYFSGNWILAIAAYDSGEGTISRAIKSTARNRRYVQFWNLPVPRETKVYVPRLLALAEIINNPKRYKITLPTIPYLPYFEEVNIGSQIDLNHAAKLAGISYKELIKLNPGYNRWTTAPYKPFKLLIPAEKVERFNLNLSNIPEDKRVSWTKHQVKRGDNLDSIAKRYNTTANLIKQLNQLTSNKVKLNQSLLIPSSKNSPAVAKIPPQEQKPAIKQPVPMKNIRIIHIVQNNDSYQKIQKTYGVAAKDIRSWNKLANNTPLRKGQHLVIWKRVKQPIEYIIKSGDSLSVIAKKHQTKVNTIISLNPGLKKSIPLRLGQKILIG